MTFSKKQIFDLLEQNRSDLETQFPETEGLTVEELFDYFFAVSTSTSSIDEFVVFEKSELCLKAKFGKHAIPSLNKFRNPL